ncbi:MAG: hypothetical protein ACFCGT_26360 [Sandaracinaceae bacterium]
MHASPTRMWPAPAILLTAALIVFIGCGSPADPDLDAGSPVVDIGLVGETPVGAEPLGYHDEGPWRGEAFAVASPADGSSAVAIVSTADGGPYCIQGFVPGPSRADTWAGVGFHVNQEPGGEARPTTWAAGGFRDSGIVYEATLSIDQTPDAPGELEIALVGPVGSEVEAWTAAVDVDSPGLIPWADFTAPDGRRYGGEPFTTVLAAVPSPGDGHEAYHFDLCVRSFAPDREPARGYHVDGDLRGWVWTATDEAGVGQIYPRDFDHLRHDGPYCVSGIAPDTDDASAFATLIFGVNESRDGTVQPYQPARGGGLRLQLTVNRDDLPLMRLHDWDRGEWCILRWFFPNGEEVVIPWTSFQACWQHPDVAEVYDHQPLREITFHVHGPRTSPIWGEGEPRPFDYCVATLGTSTE